MPFQALPIAFRKVTGSPLAKMLLIYLTWKCELSDDPDAPLSDMYYFDAGDAADFCESSTAEVIEALEHLERLRLVQPEDRWLYKINAGECDRRDTRWDFICITLPVSTTPAASRKRFKASDDQLSQMWDRDGYRCITCGVHGEEVDSWHVDHIIPRSRGGADVEENCQAICGKCNSRKGSKVHFLDFLGAR